MHITVQTDIGAEATALIIEGGEGGHRQGFQCLWDPPGDGDLLHTTGTGDISGIRQLVGGGKKLVPGKGGTEEDDVDPQKGEGGAAGVRMFLKPWCRRCCSLDRRSG